MIQPHGSERLTPLYVEDDAARNQLLNESQTLSSLTLNSAAAANAVMLGAGYFTPLTGYMNLDDMLCVADNFTTQSGVFWPVPIVNLTQENIDFNIGDRIVLNDPNVDGSPALAIQTVENIETVSQEQLQYIAQKVYGTNDTAHPGVATFLSLGNTLVSGPIQVLNYSYFEHDFKDTFKTAPQIRNIIQANGWKKVVAFQTRNPMHRAHEELCKMALQDTDSDGVLIHMLLGKLKAGDIPADVRNDCIQVMVDNYFPKNTVTVTGYGFDMLYAGPREAVLHAIFRQNSGCSYLIVGRDHAGVGDYYGAFEAQDIFDTSVPEGTLAIQIYKADHTAYSKKLNKVVMMRDAADHSKEDFILLSGTKVRAMLDEGIAPPPEFSRPEVAKILIAHYQK
jgi:sulfate adenylyltransferase